MFYNWKFPLIGILIVGLAAGLTPLFHLSEYEKTVPLFILFVMFIGGLQVLEYIKRKSKKNK